MPSEKNAVRVYVTDEENEKLKKQAVEKDLTVSNFVRKKLGLPELVRGNPNRKKTEVKK